MWVEREIIDMLYLWSFLQKKGAWITFDEEFVELLKENGFDCPEKIQGENRLNLLLEENAKLTQFLLGYFKNLLSEV